MPDIIVKQQPATSLTVQSNSTQLLIRQAAANNITVSTTGSSYVLPTATNSTLGGIIVGSNLTIANGVLSATSASGGVTTFNNRTGNVTLTANDVTAVANGIYIVDSIISNIPTFEGPRLLYGQYQTRGQAPAYPYVSGSLGIGSMAIVGVVNSSDPCNIEFSPGDIFNVMRFRSYDKTIVLNSDGFSVETGTANWYWSANTILTQGRGDARYQNATNNTYANLPGTPNLSLYLTTANAATTYLPAANFTYANITGKPTLANVATSGNYNDLSNKPASYTLPAATNSTLGGVIVGSGLAIANGVLSSTTVNIDGGSATTTGTGSYDGGSAASN